MGDFIVILYTCRPLDFLVHAFDDDKKDVGGKRSSLFSEGVKKPCTIDTKKLERLSLAIFFCLVVYVLVEPSRVPFLAHLGPHLEAVVPFINGRMQGQTY
jgi:hypothetical protein